MITQATIARSLPAWPTCKEYDNERRRVRRSPPAPLCTPGLDRRQNTKPGPGSYALAVSKASAGVRCRALSAYRVSLCARQGPARAFGSHTAGWGKPVAASRPCCYGIEVATDLHGLHQFLERAIVRVLIAILWQIGYTVNQMCAFGQTKPDERYKRGAISRAPSAPASTGGRATRVRGPWGTDLIALGAVALQIPLPTRIVNQGT